MDITGEVFGKLTVIELAEITSYGMTKWRVRCECGNEKVVFGKNMLEGLTLSCGCMQGGRSGLFGAVKRTHAMSKERIYTTWINIRQRCSNPKREDYRIYGGRGIKVCDDWNTSFEAFYRDMGPTYRAGLTIDRIDSNGNYEPENCRWVPMSEQWKTRRSHGARRADGSSKRTDPPDLEEGR